MFNLKSAFLFLLFISSSALAINVGKVTTIISADADSTAKEIKRSRQRAHCFCSRTADQQPNG